MSLKAKLIAAFCGPVIILLAVGLISIQTIAQSSRTLDKIFRENYDSVAAGINMKEAIGQINRGAVEYVWGGDADRRKIDSAVEEFSKSLKFQQGNVTLKGEQELNDRLTELWKTYKAGLEEFPRMHDADSRREFYRKSLLPRSDEILDTAHKIVAINLENMVSADGQVRREAAETTHTMVMLVISGVLLALLFIGIVGPLIVRPLVKLTNSVQEIQEGNLDLFVQVRSKDEIGRLAAAFNEMTSSLREIRRGDRARLLRTQKATVCALNSLSDAIAIFNPEGTLELSNETARTVFGLSPGLTVQAVENESVKELFKRAAIELRPVRHKGYDSAIQKFKDGEERFFMPGVVPMLDQEHQLIGITLVLSDITSLRRIDEAKSSLISTVSHELKTPLTSIRLATHALLSEKLGPLSPKQTEIVSAAREESDRLHQIIEKLLDISRMESGRSRLEMLSTKAERVILQVCDEMRSAFIDSGIALQIDLPGDMPEVMADRVRLEIVFANLLSNALKHTSPGGRVTVSARADNDVVRFTVEDTGSGIAEEHLPHIFEKFFRVPGYERGRDSGLGLAIVKEIVDAHDGGIEVESELGKGTRFIFTLRSAKSARKRSDPAAEA